MSMDRRTFLGGTLAGAAHLFARPSGYAAEDAGGHFDPFERVPLGKTELNVSRVGIGTGVKGWMRNSNQTRMGKETFAALLKGAYERGIRLFDMADLYGTHPYLLPALDGIPRQDYVIVSKLWFHKGGIPEPERPDADVAVERFLKELGTDYIDLVLIHCMTKPDWPKQFARQMEILAKLKEKGLIRAHGISCHALPALKAAVTEPWVDSVHARINPYGTKMDGPAEAVTPVINDLRDAGKGVIGMKIIGEGAFRDDNVKRDASVTHALTKARVSAMIVGFENTAEIDDLAARVRRVPRPATGA